VEARGGPEFAVLLIRRVGIGLTLFVLAACGGEPPSSEVPSGGDAISAVVPERGDSGDFRDSGDGDGMVESPAVTAAVDAALAEILPDLASLARNTDARDSSSVPADHSARTGEGREVSSLDLSGGIVAFPRPPRIRGVYLNAWAAGSSRRSQQLIEFARRTEINTFVIDLKDATGFISHPTALPLAQEIGADQEIRIRDLPGLLRRLSAAGVYPIARLVLSKDPILTEHRPEWAVRDVDGGVWKDDKGVSWANMFDRRVWEYNVALAREAAEMGFPEIQWDYLRFPDGGDSVMARAVYPGAQGRERPEAIREFLEYAEEQLQEFDVAITADVFGVTTAARHDLGIGQVWERFIDRVDAALPMVYPSHYSAGSYGVQSPNAYPYEIVRAALTDARNRSDSVSGSGKTRPWLQDFTLGAPRYGGPEVRAQIQAAYDTGIQDWILWNPSVRYSEAGLIPAGGMPTGTELTMLLAGEVIPVSRRFELLDAGLIARIAVRRLVPLVMPMPRYLEPQTAWGRRLDGR
jgi:hypothetical protein